MTPYPVPIRNGVETPNHPAVPAWRGNLQLFVAAWAPFNPTARQPGFEFSQR